MTREEAIKGLDSFKATAMWNGNTRLYSALCLAIAALREQEIAKDTNVFSNCCKNGNSWISVEDEKPKSRGHYFIAYKFAGSDMRFYGEAMWHDDIPDNGYVQGDHFANEGVDGMYVTHWMQIPEVEV